MKLCFKKWKKNRKKISLGCAAPQDNKKNTILNAFMQLYARMDE